MSREIASFLGEEGNLKATVYHDESYDNPYIVEFNICDEYQAKLYYENENDAINAAKQFTL
jgi:hypothetical protein